MSNRQAVFCHDKFFLLPSSVNVNMPSGFGRLKRSARSILAPLVINESFSCGSWDDNQESLSRFSSQQIIQVIMCQMRFTILDDFHLFKLDLASL